MAFPGSLTPGALFAGAFRIVPVRGAFLVLVALGAFASCAKPEPAVRRWTPQPEPGSDVRPNPGDEAGRPEHVTPTVRPWTAQPEPGGDVLLNPIDEAGRAVHINDKGRCYVYDSSTPHQPGDPPVIWVECPAELLDPAWQQCLWGMMWLRAKGHCECSTFADPPKPPAPVPTCPAYARR